MDKNKDIKLPLLSSAEIELLSGSQVNVSHRQSDCEKPIPQRVVQRWKALGLIMLYVCGQFFSYDCMSELEIPIQKEFGIS